MTPDSLSPVPSHVARDRNDQCVVLMVFLWLLMASVMVPVVASARAVTALQPAKASVDANSAPWWELTALPRIGFEIAHRIVEYRKSASGGASEGSDRRAFTCPADLMRVRGIGPKTTRRIGRYLSFGGG